jgi:hypothetical protein
VQVRGRGGKRPTTPEVGFVGSLAVDAILRSRGTIVLPDIYTSTLAQ